MRALVIAMLLPVLACNRPYNDDHETLVIEHWPELEFPFGHWTLSSFIAEPDGRTLPDATSRHEWATAAGADRAEVTRVDREGDALLERAPPRPLAAAHLARIQEVLASPRFGVRTSCLPEPGVRVRFHRGAATADLLLCYG